MHQTREKVDAGGSLTKGAMIERSAHLQTAQSQASIIKCRQSLACMCLCLSSQITSWPCRSDSKQPALQVS